MQKKENRGGSRPGAGRPKGEPTTTLSYRVPAKFAALIDKSIRVVISKITGKPYLSGDDKKMQGHQ